MDHNNATERKAPQLQHMLFAFISDYRWTLVLYFGLLCVAYPIEQILFPEIYGRIVSVLTTPSKLTLFQRTWKYLTIATALLILFRYCLRGTTISMHMSNPPYKAISENRLYPIFCTHFRENTKHLRSETLYLRLQNCQ